MAPPRNPSAGLQFPLSAIFILSIFFYLSLLSTPASASSSASSSSRCHVDIDSPEMPDNTGPSPIENLEVILKQTSGAPPTIVATVTNKNTHPVTICTYQSPLETVALGLGLFSITPAGSSQPLDLNVVKLSRMWPPPPQCFIEFQPGASRDTEFILRAPTVPMEKLGESASVVLNGRWMAVWSHAKEAVTEDSILQMHETAFTGEFASNKIDITIE